MDLIPEGLPQRLGEHAVHRPMDRPSSGHNVRPHRRVQKSRAAATRRRRLRYVYACVCILRDSRSVEE
eukprot:5810896-Pyramimonas_sp.AAC.1